MQLTMCLYVTPLTTSKLKSHLLLILPYCINVPIAILANIIIKEVILASVAYSQYILADTARSSEVQCI